MTSKVRYLVENECVKPAPPPFVYNCLQYEVIMGSEAYGCADTGRKSDVDIYGFCIPHKEIVFPHTAGYIHDFDDNTGPTFRNWQLHHIMGKDGVEYDCDIYSIVRYFALVMDNNPNMVDSLFVPERCVTFMTPIGRMVREQRHAFLSKKVFHTFTGYAHSQLHKMQTKNQKIDPNNPTPRQQLALKYGYDVKFASHLVRILDECAQILETGDLNLEARGEKLKAIRRGEWKMKDVFSYFEDNEAYLRKLYQQETSPLPHSPNKAAIKKLLIDCLEANFGSLEHIVNTNVDSSSLVEDLHKVLKKHGY